MFEISFYPKDKTYHNLFFEILEFLNRLNEKHQFLHMHWSRFEWMFARDSFKVDDLEKIIIFRLKGKIKGLLIIEDEPGVYFFAYEDIPSIQEFMLDYLVNQKSDADVIIPSDTKLIESLQSSGYEKTDWIDPITRFSLPTFELPHLSNYYIKSLDEDYRLDQIHHALWRGFDHGDDISYDLKTLEERRHMTSSPNFKRNYTFVAIYDDAYVSYAGIWYLKGSKTALIEPVATVPEHRRKGLMKACIYHAIDAVKKDGCQDVFVGSNRDVYLNIGFKPYREAIRFRKIK